MNKKILLGSLLVLILLFVMPSIPAIQQNVIKDELVSKIPEDLDFTKIKELLESGKLDRVKHPILGILVTMWIYFRFLRYRILSFSYDEIYDRIIWIEINNPIIFLRLVILLFNTLLVFCFFEGLSDKFGWNWNI
jgi:hypothetical protein